LHSLEEQEAIESYEKTADSGRKRKYYHLTESGKKLLKEKAAEWHSFQEAVQLVMGGVRFAIS